jgi:hypothetical protein
MIKKEINKEKVIEMYNSGATMITIAKYFGFKSYGPVQKVLKKEGINLKLRIGSNSRSKSLNENYFDNINTPNKAYILGWIMSDGYVSKNKLVFGLKDLEILEFIKSEMESGHKISEIFVYDKRTDKTYQQYVLQICSKKISESLNKLGIHRAKSFTVDLPKIDKILYPHLIRGLFDGDGYIGEGKNSAGDLYPRFSLILSEKLYNSLTPTFNNLNIELKKPGIVAEKDGDLILNLRVYRKKVLRYFFNYIYGEGNVIKLNRKYDKFKHLLGDSDQDPINNLTIKKYSLTGELIDTYKSIRNAGKHSDIPHQTLYYNIVKKKIEEYKGFRWEVSQ